MNNACSSSKIKSTTLFLKIITNFSKIDENLGKNSGKMWIKTTGIHSTSLKFSEEIQNKKSREDFLYLKIKSTTSF